MVQVAEGWGGQLEGTEADVVQSLIVKDHALISILYKLVDREGGVVGLNNCVRHLQRATCFKESSSKEHHLCCLILAMVPGIQQMK